jgi:hypothetical protein
MGLYTPNPIVPLDLSLAEVIRKFESSHIHRQGPDTLRRLWSTRCAPLLQPSTRLRRRSQGQEL